jgi:secreted PhoX family phosphatase
MATSTTPELVNVDNVYAAANGDVYVAEDPGSLQIVALTPSGQVKPIVQVTGQTNTEITGPALSPDGTRLYFNSQRNPGKTYEVTGPFDGVPKLPFMNQSAGGVLVGALATLAALRQRGK